MEEKRTNPFSLNFGIQPREYISRRVQEQEIISNFEAEPSPVQVYMITGVRGAGKTVMLSEIAEYFQEKDWLVFDLSIETDLMQSFAAKLYNVKKVRRLFMNAKLNFSYLGFGIEVEGSPAITDLGTAIESMLDIISKKNMRILITIDEVINNAAMRKFASEFQILLRKKYPVYLLMTGLYENIYELQNVKTLTFLYRAPKAALTALDPVSVANSYEKIFGISAEKAKEMAALIKGYPYAYQVLGYLYWNQGAEGLTEEIVRQFDEYMSEYVYSKMWSEQSGRKRAILKAMVQEPTGAVTAIRESLDMSPQEFSVYRSRLIRQGLICADGYGYLKFTLPRFGEFVSFQIY